MDILLNNLFGNNWDLKLQIKSSQLSFTQLPLSSTTYVTIVHLSKLGINYFVFYNFFIEVLFLFKGPIPDPALYLNFKALWSLLPESFSWPWYFWWVLINYFVCWLDFIWCLLIFRLRLYDFNRNTTKVIFCLSQYIDQVLIYVIIGWVNFDHLGKVVPVKFFYWNFCVLIFDRW